MKSLFDEADRRAILARIDRLTPESPRQWGTMDVLKMLCHCTDQLRMALGEVTDTVTGPAIYRFPPVRWLVINVLPWPQGAPTAPALLRGEPEAFERDRDHLVAAVERFVARGPEADWAPHPLFGALDGTQWGRLAHRHLDHHLRQFGV